MHDGVKGHCEIVAGDLDYVVDPSIIRRDFPLGWPEREKMLEALAASAWSKGGRWLSLYARGGRLSEAEVIEKLVIFGAERPKFRCLLHFFEEVTVERALERADGWRPLLNYVSAEAFKLRRMLPLLKRWRCPVVVQPIGDDGIPDTAAGRIALVRRVVDELLGLGLSRSDIYVDALSPAIGAFPCGLGVSLDTVTAAKQELGVQTIAWPHNVGLGHSCPNEVAATYVSMAIQAGLDLAVISTANRLVTQAVDLANALRATGGTS